MTLSKSLHTKPTVTGTIQGSGTQPLEEGWLKGQCAVWRPFGAGVILGWSCSDTLSSWPSLTVHLVPSHTRVQSPPVVRSLPSTVCPSSQGLCFNGSAFILYFSAAIVDASSVSPEKEGYNFNSWAASSVSESSQTPPISS